MNDNISLRTWLEKFASGAFEASDFKTQIAAGWFDWFCKDGSLAGKTKKLGPKVKRIAKSVLIDQDKTYVFFKNNCPMAGSLYDDFRICDIETGDVIYTIVPSNGHKSLKGKAEVWGRTPEGFGPLVEGSWEDVCDFFGV